MEKKKSNNPNGRPEGEHGPTTPHTLRIPDKIWDEIRGNKSAFIISAIASDLKKQQ